MIYRVVVFHAAPKHTLAFVEETGGIIREWGTDYRGAIAFVGQGRVRAVAQLRDVKPGRRGGFRWCFAGLRHVDGVKCGRYDSDRIEDRPLMLDATAQAALNELFPDVAPPAEIPVAVPLDEPIRCAPVEAVREEDAGQLAMF
jgi:hypothetical protein